MKRTLVIAILVIVLSCGLLPAATFALTARPAESVRILVLPMPTGQELLLIASPCNQWWPGSVSIWLAVGRGYGIRTLTLTGWQQRSVVLNQGWLQHYLATLPTAPRCGIAVGTNLRPVL